MESVGGKKKDKVQSLPLKNDHVHVWQCHDGTQKDLVYLTSVPFQLTDGKLLIPNFKTGHQLTNQSGEGTHFNRIKYFMFRDCRSVDVFYFRFYFR